MLLFPVAFYGEVLICERQKDTLLDILVECCTAKGNTEIFVFLPLEEGAYSRRRIIVIPDFVLDKLRGGVILPDFEGSAFRGEPLLIASLGLFRAIPFLRRIIGVKVLICSTLEFAVNGADMYAQLLGDFFF